MVSSVICGYKFYEEHLDVLWENRRVFKGFESGNRGMSKKVFRPLLVSSVKNWGRIYTYLTLVVDYIQPHYLPTGRVSNSASTTLILPYHDLSAAQVLPRIDAPVTQRELHRGAAIRFV